MSIQSKIESFVDVRREVPVMVPIGLSLFLIALDLLTPTPILLSTFFVIPVIVAAWYNGVGWAVGISLMLPLARLIIAVFIEHLWPVGYNVVNAADRILVLLVIAFIASRLSGSMRLMQKEVKVLEGMIPICARCKKIRDEKEVWQPLEKYISDRSETTFTHGLCPECMEIMYGDKPWMK
jgi:hypothetical protein